MLGAHLKVPLSASELSAPKLKVMVDGAAGYVASRIVERLLASGHTVHAAVRSRRKAAFLEELPGARERLVMFEGCDLMAPGTFDEAMKGCNCVMHTASPFILGLSAGDVRSTLIEPAVEGTKNVLGSVNRTPSVKRVVMTSSIAAVLSHPIEGFTFSEADWNVDASEAEFGYELSKMLAEQTAWEIAKAQGRWDLVVLNPGLVMGPPLSPQHAWAQSTYVMRRVLRGDLAAGYPDYNLRMVDVRDVARAHTTAMVKPDANGRYLLTPHEMTFHRIAQVLREGALSNNYFGKLRLPSYPLPVPVLWVLADLIDLERYRLTTHCGVKLLVNGTRAERELLGKGWIDDADTYNEMALAMYAMGPEMVNWWLGAIRPEEAAAALRERGAAPGAAEAAEAHKK